jgi:hypothetical protein
MRAVWPIFVAQKRDGGRVLGVRSQRCIRRTVCLRVAVGENGEGPKHCRDRRARDHRAEPCTRRCLGQEPKQIAEQASQSLPGGWGKSAAKARRKVPVGSDSNGGRLVRRPDHLAEGLRAPAAFPGGSLDGLVGAEQIPAGAMQERFDGRNRALAAIREFVVARPVQLSHQQGLLLPPRQPCKSFPPQSLCVRRKCERFRFATWSSRQLRSRITRLGRAARPARNINADAASNAKEPATSSCGIVKRL